MSIHDGQEPGVSAPAADDGKAIATLKAHFALAGHELRVIGRPDGGRYIEVSRWGQARMFGSVHGVQVFLTQIGGAA